MRFFRRPSRRALLCPVCKGCFWSLPSVSFDVHPTNFLKSKITSMEGPWGTCNRCLNHFHFGGGKATILDRAGGLPAGPEALQAAVKKHEDGKDAALRYARRMRLREPIVLTDEQAKELGL